MAHLNEHQTAYSKNKLRVFFHQWRIRYISGMVAADDVTAAARLLVAAGKLAVELHVAVAAAVAGMNGAQLRW